MNETSLEHPLAHRRTADDWDEAYIINLFHHWFERQIIKYELTITSALSTAVIALLNRKELDDASIRQVTEEALR